jgi:hypothetical protein
VQLEETEIKWLILRSRDIFMSENMLLELEAPVKLCGDIHGVHAKQMCDGDGSGVLLCCDDVA